MTCSSSTIMYRLVHQVMRYRPFIARECEQCSKQFCTYSKDEPEYLKLLVPEIQEYPLLNFQMKGYDFSPLEHYAKYVARTATHMRLVVIDSWPTPGRVYQIKSFVPGTMVTEKEYKLTLYERNVQIGNLPSTMAPLFLRIIQNSLPEGIRLSVHLHNQEHEDDRYIPDLELKELQHSLGSLTLVK